MSAISGSASGDFDQVGLLHCVLHTETTLEQPISQVWAVFADMRRWYMEYTFEVLQGPPYRPGSDPVEGQILKVTSSKGVPRAPGINAPEAPDYFISKTLKVVHEKEIVNVLSGSAFDWRRYTAFYHYRLKRDAAQTRVSVDQYAEMELLVPIPRSDFAVYYDQITANWHRSWSNAFVNLRRALTS